MNHTQSGAIAIGAAGSRARYLTEAQTALDDSSKLMLTDEGRAMLARYFRLLGYEWEVMSGDAKIELIHKCPDRIYDFLATIIFSLNLN